MDQGYRVEELRLICEVMTNDPTRAPLPPHEPDYGRPGNPIRWCGRCRLDAARVRTEARNPAGEAEELKPQADGEERTGTPKTEQP